jgi:hypothetical protein
MPQDNIVEKAQPTVLLLSRLLHREIPIHLPGHLNGAPAK